MIKKRVFKVDAKGGKVSDFNTKRNNAEVIAKTENLNISLLRWPENKKSKIKYGK